MVHSFLLLILLQLCGDMIAAQLNLPVPGMVLGLALLLGLLVLRGERLDRKQVVPADLDTVAQGLHGHLALLFVPAGVGVLAYVDLLAAEGPAIILSVLFSTIIGIATGSAIAALRPHAPPPSDGRAP